ncbi:Gfo/Idh/MocA family oxidoreductase [Sediminivirga luteola]|uniref:Myo-inositol 2-dehydrogenase n=1 Tax=Sediminivirga luteola TaxID=1774748 RepID=A0A8J2TWV9_9MICO|nr:Gfo/Idh/MocA family oxidoreductase [Sediminivirga luteola]GGA10089.1 myo-inositol 2-dehydrogenase [Sediminivirga luteola]
MTPTPHPGAASGPAAASAAAPAAASVTADQAVASAVAGPASSASASPAGRSPARPVRLGLIGAGWIGTFHAETIATRIPGAVLTAVADPRPGAAECIAAPFGATAHTDAHEILADPAVDGVVIASPAFTHTDLVVAAAEAGKAVFVEKPMALTLADADRAVAAAARAGVPLQVGFNRRFSADFAAAHRVVEGGGIGVPQLMRSLTRDPGLADPSAVKPWVIFLETLIHDFDTLAWFNPGARPVEVSAFADALVAPDYKPHGLLDTAVVTIRYDNGALATAEASFSAVYGYDVRGEFFGSGGMVTAGHVRATAMRHYAADGQRSETTRQNIDLFHDAYTAELVAFAEAVRSGEAAGPTGHDARAALAVALACIESVTRGGPVRLDSEGAIVPGGPAETDGAR